MQSAQHTFDHIAGHIGEPVVPAGMAIGEFRVVEPHQV